MGGRFSVINIAENRGFTLLELMITLLIAGIILSIGVPSFRGVMQNQRMTTATNEMVMSLNLAKSEAIK
ncbi:MAG: prepilin-type N-terminal cleavage/methylation domain-containing protein, partial [Gammaproteobacteria bacterium]|nr:prepilin-type N-terminal cleavage/methylation domain-containing protein [Gammaproteobacteria bacterium]